MPQNSVKLLTSMNTELNVYIRNAWLQLKDAATKESWPASQEAFRKMERLQNLEQQSRNLQQQIAHLSDADSVSGHIPVTHEAPFVSDNPPDGTRRTTIRPKELRIGTHRLPISINNQIAIATANWILKQGKVIPTIRNFVHPTDSGFPRSATTRRLDNGSFMEIGDSQDALIQKARKLLNICGFRDLNLEVLLENGTLKTA
jgi:hypothetical protein